MNLIEEIEDLVEIKSSQHKLAFFWDLIQVYIN